MTLFRRERLGELLLRQGQVDPVRLDAALERGAGRIGERLEEQGAADAEAVAQALAEQFRLPYVDLRGHEVQAALMGAVPMTEAYQRGFLPLTQEGSALTVAISDPLDLELDEWLERRTGWRVDLRLASRSAILAALRRSSGENSILREVTEDFRLDLVREDGQGQERVVALDALGEDGSPIITLTNALILAALQKRASDIHIETHEQGISVKYRIDGVLYPATEPLDVRHHAALVSRLKVMAELDIAEKRVPQDGRFRLRAAGRDIDFRLSVLPAAHGEDVVIRILDKSALTEGGHALRLDRLGLEEEVLRKLRRAIREPHGMVLITGPTGSGKTTTLYAALSELDREEEKIITIEDPVEYQLEQVVQIPVNEKKGLSFAKGLRSILRHDPDKIMVGEIRDAETAAIAVQAALTGHLVFTTVHANNAFEVISRFQHMGLDVHSFVSSLNCVMAQRLVRLLCPECRRPAAPDSALLELSGLEPGTIAGYRFHEAPGCGHCHGTGYRGRAAITEFLDLSPRLRQAMLARQPEHALRSIALEEGLVPLRQSALRKVAAGVTSLREINRVTFVD